MKFLVLTEELLHLALHLGLALQPARQLRDLVILHGQLVLQPLHLQVRLAEVLMVLASKRFVSAKMGCTILHTLYKTH